MSGGHWNYKNDDACYAKRAIDQAVDDLRQEIYRDFGFEKDNK